MPYKECDECNVQLVYIEGSTDSRQEWVETNYECPECKALYVHRREFDQNGLVISDTFEQDPGDLLSSPEKEDAVREALGVEKKFEVHLRIPVCGLATLKGAVVMAVNEEDAKKKAIELIEEWGEDALGNEPEEAECNYDYGPSTEWEVTVTTVE